MVKANTNKRYHICASRYKTVESALDVHANSNSFAYSYKRACELCRLGSEMFSIVQIFDREKSKFLFYYDLTKQH